MSVSPLHVHVQDNTPLHVHVKKPKKGGITKQMLEPRRNNIQPGAKAKRKSYTEPWVPAPGRTSSRDKFDKSYKWKSEKAQLEITSPDFNLNIHQDADKALQQSDLTTEEDNKLRCHISDYEKKIESLMAEVGTLRNETKNMSIRVVNKQCDNCSGDAFTTEAEESSSEEIGFINAPDSKEMNQHLSSRKSCQLNNCCDCIKKMERAVNEIHEKQCKKTIMQKNNASSYLVDSNQNDLRQSLDLPDSKVSFQEPVSGSFANKEKLNDSKDYSSQMPSTEKMSFEEWGRSFGISKADSSLELKKVEQELEDREEQLEMSKAVLEDKQKELRFIAKEFEETEKENARLRKSMERYQDDLATSIEKLETMTAEDDALHRHLVQVEVCGAEAGKQVAALRDVLQRLKYEKRLSHSDVNALNKQRELFLQKLDEFETSNRTVRRLLQSEHKTLSDVKRLESQRDMLMKKLADSDSELLRLRSEIMKKDNDLEQLLVQVSEEKNHARTLNELNKSIEATRAHLQRELRTKEMENNRLHVQLKNMEKEAIEIRQEAERLSAAAKAERESLAAEKDGLKRAARSLRNRAEKAEDSLKDMEGRMMDRERKLEEARSQADAWRERYQRASDEKARIEDHVQSLAEKVKEKESKSRTNEILQKNREDEMKKHLDRLTSENVRYRSEMDRVKADISLAEEKCRQAQQEATTLRTDIRQQESIEADLRTQLRKAKNETEEALLAVERVERNSRRMREDGSNEIDRVREQMLERMKELQPLPEILKETEMKLQDAQDKLHVYEQRSAEQTRIIAELSSKDDNQSDVVNSLKQRISALNDENRALEARLQILHVKLDDRDMRVKESVIDTVNKDERLQQIQLKMEEVGHERDSLKRQLENAIVDSRKTVESEIEKASARDRANQARIIDLETNITRLKADIAAVKRSKEDIERRSQSKLQDARDRLEQAESTNRSMRNYVNFLKKSYTNVFGADSSLTSTPIRSADRDLPVQSSFF